MAAGRRGWVQKGEFMNDSVVTRSSPAPGAASEAGRMQPDRTDIVITETCPDCNAPMRLQKSRFGGGSYFLGCTKYPKCKGTVKATPKLLQQIAAATPTAPTGAPTVAPTA